MKKYPILIFDGECNFCRACVRWLVKRDPEGRLRYASLQSEVARKLLADRGAVPDRVESVALIEDGTIRWKSDAVLESLKLCQSKWKSLYVLHVIPHPIRDWGYDLVSNHRPFVSRLLGTINHKWIPSEKVSDRFLAD